MTAASAVSAALPAVDNHHQNSAVAAAAATTEAHDGDSQSDNDSAATDLSAVKKKKKRHNKKGKGAAAAAAAGADVTTASVEDNQQHTAAADVDLSSPKPSKRAPQELRTPASARNGGNSSSSSTNTTANRPLYTTYLSPAAVATGLSNGSLVQGALRVISNNVAFVSVAGRSDDIFIDTKKSRNRAMDGDVVAVQLLTRTQEIQRITERTNSSSNGNSNKNNTNKSSSNNNSNNNNSSSKQQPRNALEQSLSKLVIESQTAADAEIQQEQANKLQQQQQQPTPQQQQQQQQQQQPLTVENLQQSGVVVAIVTRVNKRLINGYIQLQDPLLDYINSCNSSSNNDSSSSSSSNSSRHRSVNIAAAIATRFVQFMPLDRKSPIGLIARADWPLPLKSMIDRIVAHAKSSSNSSSSSGSISNSDSNNTSSSNISNVSRRLNLNNLSNTTNNSLSLLQSECTQVLQSIYVGRYSDDWQQQQQQPTVTIIKHLGPAGDIKAETEAILRANDILYYFRDNEGESKRREEESNNSSSSNSKSGDDEDDDNDSSSSSSKSNSIDFEFPAAVMAEVDAYRGITKTKTTTTTTDGQQQQQQQQPWRISPHDLSTRRDYRHKRIFTIDPLTARDLDDALHITVITAATPATATAAATAGVYEIGVHIADVTAFVAAGTALDREAQHRATSVYLQQQVIPMLPRLLCEQLCSLNPGSDRLAFSVVFYMNGDGELLQDEEEEEGAAATATTATAARRRTWFGRTIINSCAKLDYGTAQEMIDLSEEAVAAATAAAAAGKELAADLPGFGRVLLPHTAAAVITDVRLMNTIAVARRAIRMSNGSLTLSNVKLSFKLDDDRVLPVAVAAYPLYDSNRLIEEMMLLANILVAHKITSYVAVCELSLLRRHEAPDEEQMKSVIAVLEPFGYNIDTATAGSVQHSLSLCQALTVGNSQRNARQLIEGLVTRPMVQARYFCTYSGSSDSSDSSSNSTAIDTEHRDWSHFALSFPRYTHFTSPIRRYADCIVHRLLQLVLDMDAAADAADAAGAPSITTGEGDDVSAEDIERQRALCRKLCPSLSTEATTDIAEICNTRKTNAKKASEQSAELFLCVLLHERQQQQLPALTATAIIVDIDEKHESFTLMLPEYGFEQNMKVKDLTEVTTHAAITNVNHSKIKDNSSSSSNSGRSNDKHNPDLLANKVNLRLELHWRVSSEPQQQQQQQPLKMFDAVRVQIGVKWTPPIKTVITLSGPYVHEQHKKQ